MICDLKLDEEGKRNGGEGMTKMLKRDRPCCEEQTGTINSEAAFSGERPQLKWL